MAGPSLFNIPAGFSFADTLAKGIFEQAGEDPLSLAGIQIFLPTRRARRTLREAFLRLSDRPLLLPKMSPLGDIDEEELSFFETVDDKEFSLPPACPRLRRKFFLANLIAAQNHGRSFEQDLALADTLGVLMDQIYTENLDMKDLPSIVDKREFARHWEVSIKFLELISLNWPKILEEEGMIDEADRRNRLLNALSDHWQKNPPQHRIIAAGSTGSIPATRKLLSVIAMLPQGCVVLPGLDQDMDNQSWKTFDDTHPQSTLRHLVTDVFNLDPKSIPLWPTVSQQQDHARDARFFASEIMRPAQTVAAWQKLKDHTNFKTESLSITRYECENSQEEAMVIALALRESLETPKQRAALVTPDRKLAKRVAAICRRWDIELDDSGGQPLSDTGVGTFIRLCLDVTHTKANPLSLLAFCKHNLCLPKDQKDWRGDIRALDKNLLRGPAPQAGFDSYRQKITGLPIHVDSARLLKTINFIERAFTPLNADVMPAKSWIEGHIHVCGSFCDPQFLWANEDGEAAAQFFSELLEHAALLPDMTIEDYMALITQSMKAISVRPPYGLHPRVMILGQLEARLVETDVMILAGLNEGTWPPKMTQDPWMSRPMRKKFGLPPQEGSIALAAHDFAQALCAKKVILTRSARVDTTPSVPARWLQRMDTVLKATGTALQKGSLLESACILDKAQTLNPVKRPEPRPPLEARPRRLSVTKIDTWIYDPYSIYARSILKLKKLEPVDAPLDARMRGTILHKALEHFVARFPRDLPKDAQDHFIKIAHAEMEMSGVDPATILLWNPRISKAAQWLVQTENRWRADMVHGGSECEGKMDFSGRGGIFTLTAKADRIDFTKEGTHGAVIDYKSGGTFSLTGMVDGRYTQLPLEALILECGGFQNLKAVPVERMSYWVINGGGEDGGFHKTLAKQGDVERAKSNAKEGLQNLIDLFDHPETPYYSLPRSDRRPRFNDYEHLARVQEWTALDDDTDEGGEAA